MAQLKVKLMLDSGAFGAWKHNETLDLNAYIRFIQERKHLLSSYVTLDVIPGSGGKMHRGQNDVERSASASYANFQKMKEAGLDPIPVFHMGERFYWLERMMDEGETYIGISPYLNATPATIMRWLDSCFSATTDAKGHPLVKSHGFGATGHQVLVRYPWFSVDSTSWVVGTGYGKILVPPYTGGVPDYLRPPITVFLTDRPRTQPRFEFAGLGVQQQACVLDYLKRAGSSLAEARTSANVRKYIGAYYYVHLEAALTQRCSFLRQHRNALFEHVPGTPRARALEQWATRIIYSTFMHTPTHNTVLTDLGITQRLLSYYEIKESPLERLEEYVKVGYLPLVQGRRRVSAIWSYEPYLTERRLALIDKLEGRSYDPHRLLGSLGNRPPRTRGE